MNNDLLKKSMLNYIDTKPCGVVNFRDSIKTCDFSIIRYIFCILKDLERRDKKIKSLQKTVDNLQEKLDSILDGDD